MSTLVACIGNVFLGDDGFGVEVARRLQATDLPDGVRVVDFGVRAIHLAYELLEPYDAVVLVDTMSRGAAPGTLFVVEPEAAGPAFPQSDTPPDGHGLHPASVLRLARELGARLDHVRLVACEPAQLDEGAELSPSVSAAIAGAVRIVHELVQSRKEKTC